MFGDLRTIHTEIAQEIAAGYATSRGSGTMFREFADYGTISSDFLAVIVQMQLDEQESDADILHFNADYCMEILSVEALANYLRTVLNELSS